MLIYAYGHFWNPDIVNWSGKDLAGIVRHKKKDLEINFWEARGIYVLYSEFRPIYVGKAYKLPIGKRLADHLSDRLAGRWDMFSWYSMSKVNTTYKNIAAPPKKRITLFETINGTLEALAILIADPPLNRRRESLRGAKEAAQKEQKAPMTVRKYLQTILDRMGDS